MPVRTKTNLQIDEVKIRKIFCDPYSWYLEVSNICTYYIKLIFFPYTFQTNLSENDISSKVLGIIRTVKKLLYRWQLM